MPLEILRKARIDDTLDMGYYIDDFTDPWKKADTMLMQTGCNKPRQLFYAWIPTLARHFRVIRPHLRGHWESTPAPPDYQWTMEGLCSDLKNLLDALELDKVHYVGESMGALIGFHFAYRYPERLKTLTLVTGPSPSFKHHPVAEEARLSWTHKATGSGTNHNADRIKEFGPENRALAEWVNREVAKNSPEASRGYMQAAIGCEVNVEEFLPKITVPTLLITGADHARIITKQEAERFCRLMPHAKLVTFPGVSAQCQYVVPERCAEEVLRFVREQAT